MGRVSGSVPLRRNRSYVIGEVTVAVLQREPGLTAAQIAERIVPVVHMFRFNNSTLGWIIARTPGIVKLHSNPHKIMQYGIESGRVADLPNQTRQRLEQQLEKFHPPSGDDGN